MKLEIPKKLDPTRWKLTGWRRTAAYVAFFLAAFLVGLRLTFPVEAVRERILLDAAAQGYQVKLNDLSPSGLVGVRAREVTVVTADGTRLPIEELTVDLRLWPTLLGRRAFNFDASLYDGRITGFTDSGKGQERFLARIAGVDLARSAAIRSATGLDLAGVVSGLVDLTLDPKDPQKSTGTVDLQVRDAAIRGGKIPVPGMEGGLTVPPVKLGAIAVKGAVKGGRADFGTLEAKGDDLDVRADQVFVQLQPRLDHSPLNGKMSIRPTDAFWRKEQVAPLKPVLEMGLASAKGAGGAYGFQIYGTLAKPQARPAAF
ncbi:MAG TPA: type II secretion system protein GspN [Anaeromyxobacteraceae bacterium]|nr:type II secretion system protein GspN [Anaeromyxobacteraceae bacterium]